MVNRKGGGKDNDGQLATFTGIAGGPPPPSWTSLWMTRFPIRQDFLYNYFVTGEGDKVVFSIPNDTIVLCVLQTITMYENF
jgi:hypothetical protein